MLRTKLPVWFPQLPPVTLCNTIPALVLDDDHKPVLGAVTGGMSGPWFRPISQAAVYQAAQAKTGIPIIGVGGVSDPVHVAQYLSLGATAVQVGTATLQDFHTPVRIAEGLTKATMEN